MNKRYKSNQFKKVTYLLALVIVLLSVGYSAFGTDMNLSNIVAKIRLKKDVRISSVIVSSSEGDATSSYQEYNVNRLIAGITLPEADSTITFGVGIVNLGNVEAGILKINNLPENLDYEFIDYNLKDKICDKEDSTKCSLGAASEIKLKIKYKDDTSYDSSNTSFSLDLELDIEPFYTVSYTNITNNGYPTEVLGGNSLSVNFGDTEFNYLKVLIDDVVTYNYTLKDGVLTISNVTGNVEIMDEAPIYLANLKIYGNSVQDGTPTPDNPIEIKSVGEKSKNLIVTPYKGTVLGNLNYTVYPDGSMLVNGSTGSSPSSFDFYNGTKDFFPGNGTYAINGLLSGSELTYRISLYIWYNDGTPIQTVSQSGGITETFTITNYEHINRVRLMFYSYANQTLSDIKIYPQIEFGETSSDYIPFGKYKIPVKVSGKNLVKELIPGYVDNNHFPNLAANSSNVYKSIIFNNMKKGTYTFSFEKPVRIVSSVSTSSHAQQYDIAVSPNIINTTKVTITLTQDEEIYILSFRDETSSTTEWGESWVQCESGSEATSYEPYIEPKTYNIYLDEPLRKIGDIADYIDFESGKVVRYIKYKEFAYNDSWTKNTSAEKHFQVSVGDNYYSNENNLIMSNYYQANKNSTSYYWFGDYGVISVDGSRIRFKNKDISTLEEWGNWLSNLETPLYAIYKLETPIYKTIELPTIEFNGYSVVKVNTEIESSNILWN